MLDTCLDQVRFLAGLLDFEAIKTRIEACLVFEATVHKRGVRQEAMRGLHYLFLSGEDMPRGDFKAMLGMSDRRATDALGALIKRGLLKSDSPKARCGRLAAACAALYVPAAVARRGFGEYLRDELAVSSDGISTRAINTGVLCTDTHRQKMRRALNHGPFALRGLSRRELNTSGHL